MFIYKGASGDKLVRLENDWIDCAFTEIDDRWLVLGKQRKE